MKLLKRLGLLTLCLMLGICGAAAEEAAPEKLSGIDMILISASDLEDSLNFFVNHMELNVVARGTLDAQACKAIYGMEGEAQYAVVMNNVNCTKLVFIEFAQKPTKTTRDGYHAWDYGYFDVAWRCNDIDAI